MIRNFPLGSKYNVLFVNRTVITYFWLALQFALLIVNCLLPGNLKKAERWGGNILKTSSLGVLFCFYFQSTLITLHCIRHTTHFICGQTSHVGPLLVSCRKGNRGIEYVFHCPMTAHYKEGAVMTVQLQLLGKFSYH